jgi:hypothetical protein
VSAIDDDRVTEPAPAMPPEPTLSDVMSVIQSVQAMQAAMFELVKKLGSDDVETRTIAKTIGDNLRDQIESNDVDIARHDRRLGRIEREIGIATTNGHGD